MRIAYSVIKSIRGGGGIEKYTAELGSHLVQRGHHVTVYSMANYGDRPSSYLGMEVLPCPTLSGKYGEKLIAGAAAAARICARGDYDIVHQHSIAAGAFNWLASLPWRHASVLQMHGIEWRRTKWGCANGLVRCLQRFALVQHRYVTAVSQAQCRELQARYGLHAVYIPTATDVEPRVPCDLIRSEYGLEPGGYVLFASRLVPEKGAHFLIEAFKSLNTDRRLVIAGDARTEPQYVRSLKEQAAGDPRIVFTGMATGQKLKELFSNCCLYALPSVIEGLSIALLEAMSYGICCLVSDIEENREAIGDCGVTFESRNPDSLGRQLKWLLSAPQVTEALGEAARERVRRHYSWDVVTGQMEELYLSMLLRLRVPGSAAPGISAHAH